MNVVSLFTGVGGFDLGLERAGHRIVAQCEADEKARAVLRKHWPEVPLWDDVSTFDAEWLRGVGIFRRDGGEGRGYWVSEGRDTNDKDNGERGKCDSDRVDLVCGGFPCQDLSVAGKRAGLAGERSGLFFEAARISDLILGDGGWVLIENVPGLLSSNGGRDFGIVLATLADLGFHDLAWKVLDSRFFGVPQRRRRVFILARRSRGRRAAEVLLEPESGGGNHQASREARAGTAAAPSGSLANALDRRQGGADDNDESKNPASPSPDPDRVRTAPGVPGRVDDSVTAFHATQEPITGEGFTPALGAGAYIGHNGRGEDRPTCAYDPKPDGPRYAQMGNAVTVNVAEWIGHRLREFG